MGGGKSRVDHRREMINKYTKIHLKLLFLHLSKPYSKLTHTTTTTPPPTTTSTIRFNKYIQNIVSV